MAPEGLRPHSAIGAASGVTAPIEGGPSGDFCNWSSDTPAAPPPATTASGEIRGLFLCPAVVLGMLARTGVRGAAGAAFGKERSDAQGA